MILFCYRRRRYRRLEKHNAASDNEKQGIPETFGIYYAIGKLRGIHLLYIAGNFRTVEIFGIIRKLNFPSK